MMLSAASSDGISSQGGKTGVLLEAALTHLRAGHFERVLYLTGKATGQLQVVRTLQAMTSPSGECNPLGYTSEVAPPSVSAASAAPAPHHSN